MSTELNTLTKIVSEDVAWLVEQYPISWERLRSKTILITGAAGFLAAYMVETALYLNQERDFGITIISIVRSKKRFEARFPHFQKRPELICVEHDVSSPIKLDHKVDFIIHAASQASPKYYAIDPVGTLGANVFGTSNLLELAVQDSVEAMLYFSSAEIYGEAARVPTNESDYGYMDPLAVRSCYAESKRMGENMCASWCHQYGVPARIVRPFHTYGPGMSLVDGRVYADFVADVVHGRDISLKSDGLARRAFCYIADATAGFWMVLLHGENAKAYNIGNPEGMISIRDLAYIIAELFPEKKIAVRFDERPQNEKYLPTLIQVTCPDIKKAKTLGWEPSTSIRTGFRKTIESYFYEAY